MPDWAASENARTYYQMALDKLPEGDQGNHARITQTLADLDQRGPE